MFEKYNTSYYITQDNSIKQFIVYLNYKSQLKAYSKKIFDPFLPKGPIGFFYNNDQDELVTWWSIKLFRWAIENKVLDYIEERLTEIEEDMNQSVRNIYSKKRKYNFKYFKKKKRKELSELSLKNR